MEQFGHKKLVDLLSLIKDQKISNENAKDITYLIINGDNRMPTDIAADLGFTGEVKISDDLKTAVESAVKNNPEIVQVYVKTNKASPLMKLVNQVIESLGRKADPVVIQHLLNQTIEE